jgi:hypothetical protein
MFESSATANSNGVPPHRVAAIVLLGGSVRPTPFGAAIQRSHLDLPCHQDSTLLNVWCQQIAELFCASPDSSPVPSNSHPQRTAPLVRVLTDQSSAGPNALARSIDITVQIDHDPTALRGTAGLLRDIGVGYAPDEYILVANAAQILLRPLAVLYAQLSALRADVAMISHRDGTPVTLMLMRCGCLKELPEVGYMDMKEQALPLIGAGHSVKAAISETLVCGGIRTAKSYVAALRALHSANGTVATGSGSGNLAEYWRSDFQIQEDGATIGPGVKLHDSVVLRGATVGRNATLVRSVACPGAIIPPGAVVVDKLVCSSGIQDSGEAA